LDKHSKLGIASFVIAIVSIVTFFLTIFSVTILTSGKMSPESGIAILSGLVYCFNMLASLVGVGLAIGGFCTQRKSLFCWLGGVGNALFLLGVGALMFLGFALQAAA